MLALPKLLIEHPEVFLTREQHKALKGAKSPLLEKLWGPGGLVLIRPWGWALREYCLFWRRAAGTCGALPGDGG